MKVKTMAFILVLCFGVSLISAPTVVTPHPLTAAAEVQVTGGISDGCAKAIGAAVGMGIGTLTACSIICAVGAWYAVGAMAVVC